MKKNFIILNFVLTMLCAQSVHATQCVLNGKTVACDDYKTVLDEASVESVDTELKHEQKNGALDETKHKSDAKMQKIFLIGLIMTMGIFGIFFLLSIGFWMWMLIDAIRFLTDSQKRTKWIILLVLSQVLFSVGFVVAFVYYFVQKQPRDKRAKLCNNANELHIKK